jgi:hypothetical protein
LKITLAKTLYLYKTQIEEFITVMTPGQLVSAVSIALDVPHETVVVHDRNLSVAGLRTKGARGRNAPAVTPLDAARLVTAILGSSRVVDSVETVRAFELVAFVETTFTGTEEIAGKKEEYEREKSSILAIMGLPPQHSFIEGLAGLISGAGGPPPSGNPELLLQQFAQWKVECQVPGRSFIGPLRYTRKMSRSEEQEMVASFEDYVMGEDSYKNYYRFYSGILQTRTVYGPAIVLLGHAFRENGLPFTTTREAIDNLLQAVGGKKRKPSTRNAK